MVKGVFIPSYLRLPPELLAEKASSAVKLLQECTLCPRQCRVNRTAGERGFCRTGDKPFVSSWGPHFGEEQPLVGTHGSGTIFFGHCNLGCVFCQNYPISHLGEGAEISPERLAEVMLELQEKGCHNINLVTPTHQMPMILASLAHAAAGGLRIPLVYNCGGYESLAAIRLLEGVVDIYMPDFKLAEIRNAVVYLDAKDYPNVVKAAIKEMHRQVGDLLLDERGIALRGLLVRHLVLPGGLADTKEVLRFVAEEISPNTYLNIMDQYRPQWRAARNPPLDRRITGQEFDRALSIARQFNLIRIDSLME